MVEKANMQKLLNPAKNTHKEVKHMQFSGPETTDLSDVRSLNAAFLEFLSGADGERLRSELPASLRLAVKALSDRHIQRLCTVPFLLLSFSESDDNYWQQTLRDRPVRDLFTPSHNDADPCAKIASATLGFLWQLARKNPYAARLVCGATLQWCEHLAACTLLHVLERAADDQQTLGPRLAGDKIFWGRLLSAGLSSEIEIRRAAHLSALQSVLTPAATSQTQQLRTAACYSSVPAVEIRQPRDK
jgi:hypothetical protein